MKNLESMTMPGLLELQKELEEQCILGRSRDLESIYKKKIAIEREFVKRTKENRTMTKLKVKDLTGYYAGTRVEPDGTEYPCKLVFLSKEYSCLYTDKTGELREPWGKKPKRAELLDDGFFLTMFNGLKVTYKNLERT